MKRLVKTISSLIIAMATIFGGAVCICAAGSGALDNIIIPPEGRLFMPDNPATRATVAMTLYNMLDNTNIKVADTNSNVSTQASLREFSDISRDNPYYAQINYCASKGYINGYPDGTFKPEGPVTRAEICVVLSRFLSLKADNKATMPTDITAGHWASSSIAAIISNGIMSGYEDTTFKPDKKLTRAELATIIVNAGHLPHPGNIIEFSDVPKTHWAYKYVACVSAPDQSTPVPSTPVPSTPASSAPNTSSSSTSVPKPSVSAPSASAPFAFEQASFENEVAKLINEERIKAGASELKLDQKLCEIARVKAQDMIDNNYFGHKSPKWGYPDAMMRSFGITFNHNGENIEYGAVLPYEVVEDWVYSPAHYENLLSIEYKRTGVGCVKNKSGTIYWVQIFCD